MSKKAYESEQAERIGEVECRRAQRIPLCVPLGINLQFHDDGEDHGASVGFLGEEFL